MNKVLRAKKKTQIFEWEMDGGPKDEEGKRRKEQAHKSMTESIAEQQYYESKAEMEKCSAEVLPKAIEGLKQLKTTMMQAAFFWKQMQEHCKALSDNKLRDTVAKEMRKHSDSDEQQLKLWISMLSKKNCQFQCRLGCSRFRLWGIYRNTKRGGQGYSFSHC